MPAMQWPKEVEFQSHVGPELPPLTNSVVLFHIEHPSCEFVAANDWINHVITKAQSSPAKKGAQLVLRQLLAHYESVAANEIAFNYSEKGKPYLANSPIFFNASDTEDALFIALTTNSPIGLDIEPNNRQFNHTQLVKRHFSQADQALYANTSTNEQPLWALYAWTRKEALGKCIGVGIRYPMRSIDVMHDFPKAVIIDYNDQQYNIESWQCSQYDVIASQAMIATTATKAIRFIHIGRAQWQNLMQ